ncbi:MAG: nucleotidyl transferase AbiEii/AbiGii toxin family protein [Microthrixaceae bacterium]|nr:nucleotidyl transferase AbiEii/AbiGii toxin family protein [Microthrixaceae bacterium]
MIALEEAIAEKLARFRRVSLARDLYDLAWFARHPFGEALVRRLWVIKVYFDVVDDGRGDRPLVADEVLRERAPSEFVPEDIGYLTQPVDIPGWLTTVRGRFDFLRHLDADEQQWAACNPGHRYEVDSTGMAPFTGA